MTISLVVAMDLFFGIGKDNKLLFNIKEDMQHFRKLTLNKVVIMGRRTFESIRKPLKDRTNIILTRDTSYTVPGAYVYNNIQDILHEYNSYAQDQEIMIAGGSEIYKQFLPYADRIYLTRVLEMYDADTYFPKFNANNEWKLTSRQKGQGDYYFTIYERK